MYPEYDWLPWLFDVTPKNYWENKDNLLKFINWAGDKLEIKELNDWYKINFNVFILN